jgi:hypothetical protein
MRQPGGGRRGRPGQRLRLDEWAKLQKRLWLLKNP